MSPAIMLVLVVVPSLLGEPADAGRREQIGEVLGEPVYRDEIRTGKDARLAGELHRLFAAPVMQKYQAAHAAEIEPTKEEIDAATRVFRERHQERIKEEEPELRERLRRIEAELGRGEMTGEARKGLERQRRSLQAQLEPPDRSFAVFVLSGWKFQRHLYDRYGGGRVLWQQAGLEAFDAMRKWLEAHEEKGDFRITDPALRAAFYEYWTAANHGAFMIRDPERIRREFLQPEWAAGGATQRDAQ